MGGHDHIRHRNQPGKQIVIQDVSGAVFKKDIRFLLIYIQAGRADFPGLDALQQCLRIDQSTAGSIKNYDALLHLTDCFLIDHVPGLIRQRAVQRDDVTLLKQFIQRNVLDSTVLQRKVVVSNDAHAKSPADVDKDSSDPAGSNHTHSLSVKVEAGQAA